MSAEPPAIDRWLALPGSDPDDPQLLSIKAHALRVGVLCCAAADLLYDGVWSIGLPLLGCAALALRRDWARMASLGAWILLTALLVVSAPVVANHDWLKWLIVSLFVFLGTADPREQRLLLQAGRWLLVFVLLWSGVKKAMFGTYFQGEYLAYMISTSPRFAEFFSLFAPAEEILRLQSYEGLPGTGPYRIPGPLLPLLSNFIWIGEIGGGLLLVWPPARPVAWLACIALLLGIELVAREVFFGLLFTTLALSFPRGEALPRSLPWLIVIEGTLVLVAALGFDLGGVT